MCRLLIQDDLEAKCTHKLKMAVRLSLKTVLRDTVIMLCGTVLGILLAQSFMSTTNKSQTIAHLTKRQEPMEPLTVSHVNSDQPVSTKRPKSLAEELKVSTRKNTVHWCCVSTKSIGHQSKGHQSDMGG